MQEIHPRPARAYGVARVAIAALVAAGIGAGAGAGAAAAQGSAPGAAGYDFAAPPSAQANRVFGVNRQTGEVNACQFERPEGSVAGITRCFAQGQGAGPQQAGDYALMSTHYEGETGVFRINRATGEMSICYVREAAGVKGAVDSMLVCTAPAR
ncbi:hypothetical protein V5F59_20790 [Xanthobacter autotrophicus DSM 431]|uniref:hypothetical protein n=1 Tax=Xanthobacter nonsaccharivorans TaxID=3119912 RepID=UPI00372BFA81